MVAVRNPDGLVDDLERLASTLERLDLQTAVLRDRDTEPVRERLIRTLRSYLIPRLTEPDRPLSVVFAGPTGSGKSTLINSVSGLDVTRTGPLRPTTSSPVILSNGTWQARYESLGGLDCHVVEGSAPILRQMAFIDTPDIDSTSEDHRRVAETLIDTADVVVFVTSALRYADLVPWEVLRRAISRGAPVINVLNRVTAESSGAVVDFKRRLGKAGITDDLVRVPEHHLARGEQAIPAVAVNDLRRRLVGIVEDRQSDQRDVFNRVLETTVAEVREFAGLVDGDRRWLASTEARVVESFSDRGAGLDLARAVGEVTIDGPEPRSRWGRRRWLRRHRVTDDALEGFTDGVRNALGAATMIDIRETLVEIDVMEMIDGTLGDLSRDVADLFEVVFDEWMGCIEKTARPVMGRDRNLAVQTLLASGLGGGDRVAASVLFGIERDRVLDDVRSDLLARLQIIYDHVARRVVQRVRGVAVSSHFAHA
ncbi:MAG: GTPase [Actinomycetota bacterium]|nr:GTPase [Actinomycetota bacterium]